MRRLALPGAELTGVLVVWFVGQVLVHHLPGVVHGVEGRMADQESERPGPHRPLDLAALVGAQRLEIGGPVWRQSAGFDRSALGNDQADPLREEFALGADRVPDDRVAIAPAAA